VRDCGAGGTDAPPRGTELDRVRVLEDCAPPARSVGTVDPVLIVAIVITVLAAWVIVAIVLAFTIGAVVGRADRARRRAFRRTRRDTRVK
jgi:NhaP-type Na+/H+ and K+/H+ antiporter